MSETDRLQDAVTPEVVADVIAQVAGDVIDVGPLRVGPGGVARATAQGVLRRAEVRPEPGAPDAVLRYEAQIPVTLELTVEATGGRHRYTADLQVRVRASIGRDGDWAVVDLRELTGRDVHTRLTAHGLPAKLLAKVGDVEGELRREVAAYVNGRFEGDDVRSLSRIPL